jgi:hypothetical protein
MTMVAGTVFVHGVLHVLGLKRSPATLLVLEAPA